MASLAGYGEGASLPYYGVTAADMVEDLEAARGADRKLAAGDPADCGSGHCRCSVMIALPWLPWMRRSTTCGARNLASPPIACGGSICIACRRATTRSASTPSKTHSVSSRSSTAGRSTRSSWVRPTIWRSSASCGSIPPAIFRVDANCAWTAEQTIRNSRELKLLGVEFIEQPLKADDWEGMKRVFAESELPVMADESCLVEEDVARCRGFFHGINIKLVKCGGMTPARRMIAAARSLGLKVMIGCMTESTVGISAIAQFLPLLDYVDMDGAALIARDVATGVYWRKARPCFPPRTAMACGCWRRCCNATQLSFARKYITFSEHCLWNARGPSRR